MSSYWNNPFEKGVITEAELKAFDLSFADLEVSDQKTHCDSPFYSKENSSLDKKATEELRAKIKVPTDTINLQTDAINLDFSEFLKREYGKPKNPHGWIQLYSGAKFFPAEPDPKLIFIEDIAHSLSNMCRFSGHCREFYSVAQHSVLVSYLVGEDNALWGLLHDASEAYLVDMPRPVKRLDEMKPFRDMENLVMAAICRRFLLSMPEPGVVKQADTKLLATEARDLMAPLHPEWVQPCEPFPFKIEPLAPNDAKKLFLARYRELIGDE